ncbi:MAG TPA: NAD(P)H-hydrate dehydratase [Burkholderiaceae bacterium]|nr:NAD(P)H-hydrate dehydratase [Burkholderiaceae bacterium]
MGTPLLSVTDVRAIEHSTQLKLPAGTLMARAGAAIAARIGAFQHGEPLSICVVAGPGNNGGDGYVAARELRDAGHRVTCVQPARPAADDARNALANWKASGGVTHSDLPAESHFDIVVDAILGIGQTRPLQGTLLAAAQWINAQRARVIAVDVPSGLEADRGCWIGGVEGVHASETITFIADKPGLHTADGTDAAGHVSVDALGTQSTATRTTLTDPADFSQISAPRRRNTHKGSYGSALIIGGNAGMVGAALLAARAALRIGAGRVYVDCIGAPELRFDPMQPELMFKPAASIDNPQCIVIGCGLGTDDAARRALQWALDSDAPLVIDADALNLLARGPALAECLTARSAPTVLTPHPLEAARMLDVPVGDIQLDRVASAREIAVRHRSIVVLKGAGSIVADTHGRCAINPTGSPALATAGTGDVLAGLIGGLLSQAFEIRQATLAAVWLHGRAGESDAGLVAGDVALRAAEQLSELRRSS